MSGAPTGNAVPRGCGPSPRPRKPPGMNEPANSSLLQQYEQLKALAGGTWFASPDSSRPHAPPNLRRIRDLTLLALLGDLSLVIACDSNASIGEKPNDALKVPYSEVGVSALKVTLMEVLAAGAVPILIVNALCMEMEPSGRKMIEVMRSELVRSGFDPSIMLTGSTEDNAHTTQSGIGITVIGLATEERLRVGWTSLGDVVLCVGNPKSGVDTPYSEYDPDIATIRTVLALVQMEEVHEILPVGSKGVWYEANELARFVGREFRLTEEQVPINIRASAGASTAVLISTRAENVDRVTRAVSVPTYQIGTVE